MNILELIVLNFRGKLNNYSLINYNVKSLILIGPRNSGKTRETINYALKNIKEERCIYYTSSNKNNLIERISSIDTIDNYQPSNNLFIYEAPKINNNTTIIAYIYVLISFSFINYHHILLI